LKQYNRKKWAQKKVKKDRDPHIFYEQTHITCLVFAYTRPLLYSSTDAMSLTPSESHFFLIEEAS
jgi:hypothetical protein